MVEAESEFAADLYRGTAEFYDRFRLAYPRVLTEDVLNRSCSSCPLRLGIVGVYHPQDPGASRSPWCRRVRKRHAASRLAA